jgi:GT2 family glycosyltransferase
MDPLQWRAEERGLREAVRAARSTGDTDGHPLGGGALPLASVIVVCWNAADVLGRCLDQLLAQDYANYELIVVDDGSTDRTLAVAEEASSRGEMTLLHSQKNRGCPHARNLGLRQARGQIVAFVDADGFVAASWLRHVVSAFGTDATIGGVASTVFFDANPLVINGAGGIVNRQGWAADLSMNASFEHAEIVSEALYPMGCGMALRRSALERVGVFDDRMLNYYDDVDYGIRLWRAGFRVLVSRDAWIDHGSSLPRGETLRKRLLCERHRIRVVLKHTPRSSLGRWLAHEVQAFRRASWPRRGLKLKAIGWNIRHLPSVLKERRLLRRSPVPPARLLDPSWGEEFPVGVASLLTPRPGDATSSVDMTDTASEAELLYGWFPVERRAGRSYRWAGMHAATLVRLDAPARRLRLDFTHVPEQTGGVDVRIRRVGSPDPLAPVWETHLSWQYIERSIENHPLALAAGTYEVLFSARQAWSDPPRETRQLGFALASMSFMESYELPSGGLDMASSDVEDQLVSGWFEREASASGDFRWAAARAAAVIRLTEDASAARLSYRMAPAPIGGVTVSVRPLDSSREGCSARIAWNDDDWHEDILALALPAGEYVVMFQADSSWANPGQRDPVLPPENRSLALAVSSLSFS